jgi:hypothetical protein
MSLITSSKDLPRWMDAKSRTGGAIAVRKGSYPTTTAAILDKVSLHWKPWKCIAHGAPPVNGCSDWRSPCGATWQIIWHDHIDRARSCLQRVVDLVLQPHHCCSTTTSITTVLTDTSPRHARHYPAMVAHAIPEYHAPLDVLVAEMPNAIRRWDSHETSPVFASADVPKQQQQQQPLPTVANDTPRHRPGRAHGRMVNRNRQLTAGQAAPYDGNGPMPLNNADEEESCDEEIMASDALTTTQNQPEQVHILEAAMPFLSQSTKPSKNLLLGPDGEDVQEIGQWYFVCQLPERDAEFFKSVQNNWVRDIWDMGRNSQSIFSVLGAFALHKKATLAETHAKTEYYEQKGQIIQNIVSDIKKSPDGIDPMTVVAMAILAYFDIRDDQFDAAGTHLRAVRNFIEMDKLPPQGWLYCSWTDLRQALFTETEPQLPFYVPHVFREVHPALRFQQREAFRVGALNASQCPRSAIFTLDMSSDLFGKLHALCYCSDVLAPADTPPFGQVYALEYGLRVIQARAKRNADDDVFTAPIVLITSAIQLHVWMASRFYTPQARETHLALTRVASRVIDGFDDMITQWYIAAGLESLLWVLFTLVASFRAHELPQTTRTLALLYQALRKAGINSCDGFEARLKKWPWLHNWHPVQIGIVWEMLCARYPDLVPRISRPDIPEAQSDPNKARHRWFLGGLEFYNSL